jgi:hypothetical protein
MAQNVHLLDCSLYSLYDGGLYSYYWVAPFPDMMWEVAHCRSLLLWFWSCSCSTTRHYNTCTMMQLRATSKVCNTKNILGGRPRGNTWTFCVQLLYRSWPSIDPPYLVALHAGMCFGFPSPRWVRNCVSLLVCIGCWFCITCALSTSLRVLHYIANSDDGFLCKDFLSCFCTQVFIIAYIYAFGKQCWAEAGLCNLLFTLNNTIMIGLPIMVRAARYISVILLYCVYCVYL